MKVKDLILKKKIGVPTFKYHNKADNSPRGAEHWMLMGFTQVSDVK